MIEAPNPFPEEYSKRKVPTEIQAHITISALEKFITLTNFLALKSLKSSDHFESLGAVPETFCLIFGALAGADSVRRDIIIAKWFIESLNIKHAKKTATTKPIARVPSKV